MIEIRTRDYLLDLDMHRLPQGTGLSKEVQSVKKEKGILDRRDALPA